MLDTPKATRARAKRLRSEMTAPERRLWWLLRCNQLDGLHFRRQHPLGSYVLDFYCHAVRLAVEVDGGAHRIAGRAEVDAARDQWLADRGIRTLRISADIVERESHVAMEMIRQAVATPRDRLYGGP